MPRPLNAPFAGVLLQTRRIHVRDLSSRSVRSGGESRVHRRVLGRLGPAAAHRDWKVVCVPFRDATGSVFYIGKGMGTARTTSTLIDMDDLGTYVAEFLGGTYTVHILRTGLSPDDAEALESELIEVFGRQLVNWAGNLGTTLTAESVAQMRKGAEGLWARARAAAGRNRLEESASLCREALAYLSKWEQTEHDTEVHELERLAAFSLAARVDLQRAQNDYVPQAPVLACECLSDLTRCLCALGRPEEARSEVDAFTERYPRGSFRDYEFYDHRYARNVRVTITKREKATCVASRGRRLAEGSVLRAASLYLSPSPIRIDRNPSGEILPSCDSDRAGRRSTAGPNLMSGAQLGA